MPASHKPVATVVEGVVQLRIPVDDPLITANFSPELKLKHSTPLGSLTTQWIEYVSATVWSTVDRKSQKLPPLQSLASSNVEPYVFDLPYFLETAKLLNIVSPDDVTYISEISNSVTIDDDQLLRQQPVLSSSFAGLYLISYHRKFLQLALGARMISDQSAAEAERQILQLDPANLTAQFITNLMTDLLKSNGKDVFGTALNQLTRFSIRIGSEIVQADTMNVLLQSLKGILNRKGIVVAPGFERRPLFQAVWKEPSHLTAVNTAEIWVESLFSVTSHTGDPLPGRIIKTHSLFPGERATVTVETFRKETSSYSITSSVFDETSRQAEERLSSEANHENSYNQQDTVESSYSFGVQAKASWGWGDAGASFNASQSAKSVSARAVKNVANSLRAQATTVSNNRTVKIDTSSVNTTEFSEKQSIVRTIENINNSAPLNFFFRQLVQNVYSMTTVLDTRIIIKSSLLDKPRVASIQQAPDTIQEVLFGTPTKDAKVIAAVAALYTKIVNATKEMAEDTIEKGNPQYVELDQTISDLQIPRWRIASREEQKVDNLNIEGLPAELPFRGILMAIDTNTIKTEGIIVECSIASDKQGLDEYAERLQEASVIQKEISNREARLHAKALKLALDLIAAEVDSDKRLAAFEKIIVPLYTNGGNKSQNN
ncbi:hypothetical protein [Sinorhizobium meliloti]|uniref:hypothetical protein n=1 Tax=Rhizobium meliloti TaxID=382 RepID=UPI0018E8D7B5|nr:hypothetical protein [Sinorhizobium meliloti]QQF06260.1 hypothetical protein JFX10_24975 [Sinorhizobium meliloti]